MPVRDLPAGSGKNRLNTARTKSGVVSKPVHLYRAVKPENRCQQRSDHGPEKGVVILDQLGINDPFLERTNAASACEQDPADPKKSARIIALTRVVS